MCCSAIECFTLYIKNACVSSHSGVGSIKKKQTKHMRKPHSEVRTLDSF